MTFTFRRCIGTETLHGTLAHSVKPANIPDFIASMRRSRGFLLIDDGDGCGSAQWQAMFACDLLEIRDGGKLIWQHKQAVSK